MVAGEHKLVPWEKTDSVLNSRSHRQEISDRNRVEALVFELWQVVCDRIVETLDIALGDRDAHQGRGDGLRQRPCGAQRVALEAVEIILVEHLVVSDDDECMSACRTKQLGQRAP